MNPQSHTPESTGSPETTSEITPVPTIEQYHVTGDEMIAKIKQIVHEGNVRRVLIKNPEGHTLVEFPLTVGVVGAALIPMWAAVGAIVALVADCTIEVEKRA